MRAVAVVTTLAIALVTTLAPTPAGAEPVEPSGRAACAPTPFTAGFDAAVRARYPGRRITASVVDRRTGCAYDYRPGLRLTTASVLKAEIMAGVLLRAQAQGRGLTQWERDRIGPMIRTSHDPSANALWTYLGGVEGMRRVDAAFGLTQTSQHARWGLTSSSARDRTRLMRLLLHGDGGPLGASYRAIARTFLLDVAPSQRWGITAGTRPGTAVPLKNGFFDSGCCRWRIGTSGAVEAPGGGYVATIMSDGWPSQAAGIPAVEMVSRAVAARLGGPYGPFDSPAAFVEQQMDDVLGRAPTFAELSARTASLAWDGSRAVPMVEGLLNSSSFTSLAHPLIRLYRTGLKREPTGAIFAYRMWRMRTGAATLADLAEEIAHSPQLTGGRTLTDEEFVAVAVEHLMGWPAAEDSVAYWSGELRAGRVTRGRVVRAYVESPASRWYQWYPVTVASAYLTMLGRHSFPGELTYWVQWFIDGGSQRDLLAIVYRSPEYRARVG